MTPRRGDKDWIRTYSGKRFYPLDPHPGDLDWESIAHALSNMCRYTGHPREFYSVAEHSVHVSKRAEHLARAAGFKNSAAEYIARWGLIHDASEAYLADVARPVKISPEFENYRIIEAKLMDVISTWAGLDTEQPPEVTQADMDVYETEKRDLMIVGDDWPISPGIIVPGLDLRDPLPPKQAKIAFLERLNDLFALWPVIKADSRKPWEGMWVSR